MSAIDTALKPIKFSRKIGAEFHATLNKRVRDYFKKNKVSKYGGAKMVVKTIFMLSIYFVPYTLMLTGVITNIWGILLCYMALGFAMAGIGLSVMHDANHGSYSKNKNTSRMVGKVINLVGGFASTWKIQHNILHHSYTNIHGHDEDVSPPLNLLRFHPEDKYRPVQRFQFIYAWFFYGLMTLSWITTKDFEQLHRYKKLGLTKTENPKYYKLLIELISVKLFYYFYMLVLPLIFLPLEWYWILTFFLIMHFIGGLVLAMIFQCAHVVPEAGFPVQNEEMYVDNNWAIHQMQTTANFAEKNKVLTWLIGGLNYQVEHHLFPNISHVHYGKISKIVKATAKEFGVPYLSNPTFIGALSSHTEMLRRLGKPNFIPNPKPVS